MSYAYQNEEFYFHHSVDAAPRESQFSMHTHEACEIYCFLRGNGTYFIEGNEYRLSPECILLTRPGETHKVQISPTAVYERMAIHFSPKLFASLDPEGSLLQPFFQRPGGQRNLYVPEEYNRELVRQCLDAMSRPVEENDRDRAQAILCNLLPVLLELRRAFLQQPDPEEGENTTRRDSRSPMGSVVEYINRHLTEELNLGNLAARFFVSKSTLNQQFRQATGTTVWNYILIKRLLLARNAIREGTPVTEAFSRCGFTDYSAFYRRYRDRFGVSPKDDLPRK